MKMNLGKFRLERVKQETLKQRWYNVGPPSTTLTQHYNSIEYTLCIILKIIRDPNNTRHWNNAGTMLAIWLRFVSVGRLNNIEPMLDYSCANVVDDGTTLNQHSTNVLCFLGGHGTIHIVMIADEQNNCVLWRPCGGRAGCGTVHLYVYSNRRHILLASGHVTTCCDVA